MRYQNNSFDDFNKSFNRMWSLMSVMIGIGVVLVVGMIFVSFVLQYQMYEDCLKNHSKFYCINAATSNNKINITEIKDEK